MKSKNHQTYTLELFSKPKEIMRVEKFLEDLNAKINLSETKYHKLLVATTEAVNNGIIHGNKHDPKKKVVLTCIVSGTTLTVCVQDEGPGLDPSTIPDPLADENLLRENGRGVFLMKSLMDTVEFERMPGGSEVTMTMDMKKE